MVFSVSLDTPTSSSSFVRSWWFMFKTVHANLLLINPNGVNECQSGREWFAPALINMNSHIHVANHWLSDSETLTYAYIHTHTTELNTDLCVQCHNTCWQTKWPPDCLSDTWITPSQTLKDLLLNSDCSPVMFMKGEWYLSKTNNTKVERRAWTVHLSPPLWDHRLGN